MMAIDAWLASNKIRIVYSTFVLLFVIRTITGYLSATSQRAISLYLAYGIIASLIGITIFVWANKDDLSKFNIDKYVIYTLILSGVLLFLSFGFSFLGIIALTCTLLVRRALHSSKSESLKTKNFLVIFLFTILAIAPEIPLKLFAPESFRISNYYLDLSIGEIFVLVSFTLWNVMFEEMLFRSILWGILCEWKLNDKKIVITQAFLFWLVHLDGIITLSLAIPILIFGLWIGFVVLRSKSLTPGIAAHIVHNLTSRLI